MKNILSLSFLFIVALAFSQTKSKGFAVHSTDGKFQPYEFNRHAIGDNEIKISTFFMQESVTATYITFVAIGEKKNIQWF